MSKRNEAFIEFVQRWRPKDAATAQEFDEDLLRMRQEDAERLLTENRQN